MPTFDELATAQPPGSSSNAFGRDDQLGTANFLTPERVAEAARLVRSGRRFSLDYALNAFDPYPTGNRAPRLCEQRVSSRRLAGLVVLDASTLDEIADAQGVAWRGGDMLLLRTGWSENYVSKSREQRIEFNSRNKSPGLAQREEILRWLWDREIALVASDTPAVEADPVIDSDFRLANEKVPERGVNHSGMLHRPLIALLGMAVGELWKVDDLAADCEADGVYEFFLTCKPLNIVGGVGSPPNAMAIK